MQVPDTASTTRLVRVNGPRTELNESATLTVEYERCVTARLRCGKNQDVISEGRRVLRKKHESYSEKDLAGEAGAIERETVEGAEYGHGDLLRAEEFLG